MVVSTVRSHEKLQVGGGGGHAVFKLRSFVALSALFTIRLCQQDEETTEEKAKGRLYRMLTKE
jgi:hypothetical protein